MNRSLPPRPHGRPCRPRPSRPLLLSLLSLLTLLALSLALLGLRAAAPAAPAGGLRGEAARLRRAEATDVATLRAQRDAAATAPEALAWQRRIEQRKRQTELSLLRAQARAARSIQDTHLAEAIDAQIRKAEQAWRLPAEPSASDRP